MTDVAKDLMMINGERKERRGFASMSPEKQREIASKGGKAAHQKGTAHEWTSEEAREAGRKGGMASHRRKQEQSQPPSEVQGQGSEQIAASGSDSESMMGRGDES
jgi:general stress protein YciG